MNTDLSRLLEGKDFKSEEDLQAYLNGMIGKSIPESQPESAVDRAQDIVYEACETDDRKKRIRMAKEALAISPDCADAYNLLAEEAKTIEDARELYQEGIEAGRRALGEEIFKENTGHFWGYIPTRPYMRSRAGYMECLWLLGEHDEAILHAREMLRLNTGDNQGIRYILIAYLAEIGRYVELEKFMSNQQYRGDCSAEWLYTRALLTFVKRGASETSAKELRVALQKNKFVPAYLSGKKAVPRHLPDCITMGGEDEGYCYAVRYLVAWKKVPGALHWLKEQTGI